MSWDFIADSPASLADIRESLLNASTQKVLDEQVQMTHLLEALVGTAVLQYPVKVRHIGKDAVPDFQMESGERRIAVEITKIAVPDVEHARALQQNGINRTLAISSLYRKQRKPRRKHEVIAEGFAMLAESFPISIQEHDQIWLQEAAASVNAKSHVIARADFIHGDEDWLLLWDRLRSREWQLDERRSALAGLLSRYWKPDWFSRVFLQDHHFFWQMMFTSRGSVFLDAKPRCES